MQAEAASLLPPLRDTEAAKSAALHRLVVERDALEAEEARAREAAESLRLRIVQTDQDNERERAHDRDAETALTTLANESTDLEATAARAAEELTEADALAIELSDALAQSERLLERLTAELAEWNAARASHERARDVASALQETSGFQLNEAESRLEQAMAGVIDMPDVLLAQAATEQARALAEAARQALTDARTALESAERAEAQARVPLEAAERRVQMLSAEAKALADLLQPEGQGLWPPMVDAVTVQPGYEAALAAALGDDLQAPLDEAAPHHWRDLGGYDETVKLPDGAQALKEFVLAPPALDRRLTMTGVVFPDQGAPLQASLKPGQRLVSPRGDLWRWDGYAASADAPSPAAARLTQRNRLAALETEMAGAKEERAQAFAHYSAAKDAAELRARRRAGRRARRPPHRAQPDRGAGRCCAHRPRRGRARLAPCLARGRNPPARRVARCRQRCRRAGDADARRARRWCRAHPIRHRHPPASHGRARREQRSARDGRRLEARPRGARAPPHRHRR